MQFSTPLRGLCAVVLASFALSACAREPAAALPKINVDPARVMIAGLSSGAYMATQTHVALSDRIHGAALLAGGPYGCAGGKLDVALSSCMKGDPAIDVSALVAKATSRAAKGDIALLSNLAGDPVFVLHGSKDATVAESVSRASAEFYEGLGTDQPKVSWDGAREFPHLFPVASGEASCDKSESPYIGNCGYDAAGAIFTALYGPAPTAVSTETGAYTTFDQAAYATVNKKTHMADQGEIYVPKACANGEPCGVLIALHGCQQNRDAVGEAFVRQSGFNRWADVYRVAVLYPQAKASLAPLNPKACWDWWGYTGADYELRSGAQISWMSNALDALTK
ncbi:MAG: PHB depolymerase family esterase [Dokdonella sp.]